MAHRFGFGNLLDRIESGFDAEGRLIVPEGRNLLDRIERTVILAGAWTVAARIY